MLKIFYADINGITDGEIKCAFDKLPQIVQTRITSKSHLFSKKQSTVGYSLLQNGVVELFKKDINDIAFSENGKPILDFAFFSISHSKNMAVCAISDAPIGIDIQKIVDVSTKDKYPLFTREESDYVNSDKILRGKRFCEIFTKKEALAKLYGEKLSNCNKLDKENVRFSLHTDDNFVLCLASFNK